MLDLLHSGQLDGYMIGKHRRITKKALIDRVNMLNETLLKMAVRIKGSHFLKSFKSDLYYF